MPEMQFILPRSAAKFPSGSTFLHLVYTANHISFRSHVTEGTAAHIHGFYWDSNREQKYNDHDTAWRDLDIRAFISLFL